MEWMAKAISPESDSRHRFFTLTAGLVEARGGVEPPYKDLQSSA
jgi:hypothetical protein